LLRESVHYATGEAPKLVLPGAPDRLREAVKAATAGHAPASASFFHAYRGKAPIRLANLRVMTLARLFASLLTPAGARTRLGISEQASPDMLVQMVVDPNDYSAARGLSDAMRIRRLLSASPVCARRRRAAIRTPE